VNDLIGDVAMAVIGTVASMGVIVGLAVEFGAGAHVDQRWRAMIGMTPAELGPPRPRIWAVALGLALLALVEATAGARLSGALARGAFGAAGALAIHFLAVLGWIIYLRTGNPRER
jgi:hypothetical protein